MQLNNVEITLLVKGRPITEYAHRGQSFVEGRAGSHYEIQFRNNNPTRVEVVLSVDGLSVTDGKAAGPDSTGYVVDAHSDLRVPGWTLDRDQVAAFAFSGREARQHAHRVSYAEQMTGNSRNNGVVGALVYSEKHKINPFVVNNGLSRSWAGGTSSAGTTAYGDFMHAVAKGGWGAQATPLSTSGAGWSLPYNSFNVTVATSSESGTARGMAPFVGVSVTDHSLMSNAVAGRYAADNASVSPVEQSLGTAFGAATEFVTQIVSFERADLHAVLEIYYDNARGLRQRGIEIVRPSQQRFEARPQAFPGMNAGCPPPPGYRG